MTLLNRSVSRSCTDRVDPRRGRLAPLSLLLCLWLCGLAGAARAQGGGGEPTAEADPRRAVAVLGFRTGASELPRIEQRLAAILERRTSLAVVDAVEARRRYGNRLDGAVVACAGDVACVADIGRALDVAEVLLVGVSRFGDVILTLQRIDVVAGGAVRARIAEALAPEDDPGDEALLDYLRRVMPAADFRRYGVIRIDANIAGASVRVGGELRGQTPLSPLQVRAPESYDIQVEKSGFVPFEAQAAVPPDSEVLVRAVLSRRPVAWYKRWWVWALIGTAAAAGAGTGYLLLRDDSVDVVIEIPSPPG